MLVYLQAPLSLYTNLNFYLKLAYLFLPLIIKAPSIVTREKNPKKIKQAWPTQAAMEQVYEKKLWGSNGSSFYSGEGSHKAEFVVGYLEVVQSFLQSFENALTVCDLGCGDFNIGKDLAPYSKKYVAVDIVPELILRNKTLFKADNIVFMHLDLAKDELPKGDCAIIRQVFQHLSNDEILRILPKLLHYKYLILTEHIPQGDFIPNKDIISGQGIRLKKQSGIDLLQAPFHFKIKEQKQLIATLLDQNKGVILTTLYVL